jgi:hypothetical protein
MINLFWSYVLLTIIFVAGIIGVIVLPAHYQLISWLCCAAMFAFFFAYILYLFLTNKLK